MAKTKPATTVLALAIGHPTPWRQTVNVGTAEQPNRIQLVFEPNVDKEVTLAEIEGGLQPFIDSGLLVDPRRDPKGRQRRPEKPDGDANKTITKLEKKIEDLATENAQLKADLEAATAPKE
jgi:hypothetical protein